MYTNIKTILRAKQRKLIEQHYKKAYKNSPIVKPTKISTIAPLNTSNFHTMSSRQSSQIGFFALL
jgi:hypothetical protein